MDIGCGGGRLYTELIQQSWNGKYTGVDIAENILQEAIKNVGQQDFRCLNMTNINTLEEQYDAIFMVASFHHLQTEEERQITLKQIYTRLKEGGILCMINWYLYSKENQTRYKECEKSPQDFYIKIGQNLRYYHGFYPNELEVSLKMSGFFIEENRVFGNDRNILTLARK